MRKEIKLYANIHVQKKAADLPLPFPTTKHIWSIKSDTIQILFGNVAIQHVIIATPQEVCLIYMSVGAINVEGTVYQY